MTFRSARLGDWDWDAVHLSRMSVELSRIISDEHAGCRVTKLAGTRKVARIPKRVICDSHAPVYNGWITPQ